MKSLDLVVIGLSITSSWGNGHATTFRSLLKGLAARGHRLTFLEQDVPWYAANRDMPSPPFADVILYRSVADLKQNHTPTVRQADAVIVGSYVPDGQDVIDWMQRTADGVTAFYDIDTPVTLDALEKQTCEYLRRDQIPAFDLYLSFAGGTVLDRLERDFGARHAKPLFCSVDPQLYYPEETQRKYDLGYLGTYSDDRQPRLEALLLEPARIHPGAAFAVAGPQYPRELRWPPNVQHIDHIPPAKHRLFYCQQRFTLNITRDNMIAMGYSPSVRLFEAAACGTPIISDWWQGLDTLFEPEREILIAHGTEDTLRYLDDVDEQQRRQIATRARKRVLQEHTADHRAEELETYILNSMKTKSSLPAGEKV